MKRALALAATVAALLLLPAPVLAHKIGGTFRSPLPLAVYLAGAAAVVALSFWFAFSRTTTVPASRPGRVRVVPRWLRLLLRAVGLLGWGWPLVQTLIVGGSSDADVSSLFLWVYGWVGLALFSALVGPIWAWFDPFSTLHEMAAGLLHMAGFRGRSPATWPDRLGRWPAVAAFAFFVWLELVAPGGSAGRNLGAALAVYTMVTLAAMTQFGREAWRERGEAFSVWFGLLGRLAPWRLADERASGRVQRQAFASGLIGAPWARDELVVVALATAAVMYDGLSQTQPFFALFGLPGLGVATLLLFAFLGLVAVAVLGAARLAGVAALGAGIVPIAVGYIVAHYLTFLLFDGQRLVIALADPLQQGWDLLGTAFYEPKIDWLPGSVLWGIQLAAVVAGHMIGAWAGHVAAVAGTKGAADRGALVRRRLPLAALMVTLTVVTLWSLGQQIVVPAS
jgi:hypothetical protein